MLGVAGAGDAGGGMIKRLMSFWPSSASVFASKVSVASESDPAPLSIVTNAKILSYANPKALEPMQIK